MFASGLAAEGAPIASVRSPNAEVSLQLVAVPDQTFWDSRRPPSSSSLLATSKPITVPAVGVMPMLLQGIATSTLYPPLIEAHACRIPLVWFPFTQMVEVFHPFTIWRSYES